VLDRPRAGRLLDHAVVGAAFAHAHPDRDPPKEGPSHFIDAWVTDDKRPDLEFPEKPVGIDRRIGRQFRPA